MNVKLAVRKDEGSVPGGGYHYCLFPKVIENDVEAQMFRMMGFILIEVPNDQADRLLAEAGAALRHQVEIAVLAEKK